MPAMTNLSAIVRKFYIFNLKRRTRLNILSSLLIFLCSIYSWQALAVTPVNPVVVTTQVSVSYTGYTLNRATNTYDTQATLANKSGTAIQTPIQLAISNISQPTVTLANPTGVLADGTPYVNVPVSDGTLSPTETVKSLLKFNNPKRVNFTFSHSVLGVLPAANHPPVANAGSDTSAPVGQSVTLNAINSSDEDGDNLTYRWQLLEKPANSAAQLTSGTALQTGLSIDRKGSYRIELIVNDGKVDSQPAYVTINTENSKPLAKAGDDQTVKVKQTALLDGGNSSDVDGDPISYNWELLAKPSNSAAGLQNPQTQTPSLTPDLAGSYTVQLKVNDGILDSLPDQLIVSTENSKPVANAGGNQTAQVGDAVTLDGSQSSDIDNDPLSYVWSVLSKPANSNPGLLHHDQLQAILTPDLPGDYVAQLIVNDSKLNSDPATALVTVSAKPVVNHNPQITSSPLISATVGNLYNYNVQASDSDNDTLTYALTAFPSGMTINSQTGQVNWTPATNQTGSQAVSVNVGDGKGGSDSQSFSITVNAADQVNVPALIDQSRASAEAAIQQAKLNVGTLTFQHNAKADGSVMSQSPAAGSSVKIGTVVNLTVSIGPDNGLPPNPATIAPTLDPTVATNTYDATKFLYTGPNAIQTGMAADTINPVRAAVIRGKVLDKQNNPLPGVTLTILNHPEYGQTKSRLDGQFDMVINGGGDLTVNYQKDGYLPAQRQLKVGWQDYSLYEDVVLIQLDSQVTTIDLNNVTNMQVARGNAVTDVDGTRQATLLFPVGTRASMTLPNGSVQPLSTISVRATEYTVGANGPNAMPGPLPPTSAYTYAVEFSIDEAIAAGAKSVSFNQPVSFYAENFLGFPIGMKVPMAFYDRDKSSWIPTPDGKIIKILSVNGDLAELDTDGDGAIDSGQTLGVTEAERRQLAAIYPAGQSLQRIPVTHFSPHDPNVPAGLPNGWTFPDQSAPTGGSGSSSVLAGSVNPGALDTPARCPGSVIECENQILGEHIAINGTNLSLNYSSDRVPGRFGNYALDIPLSGAQIPAVLKKIRLEISIAGNEIVKEFQPVPNQSYHFVWDGLDSYRRFLKGAQPVWVSIGYVYESTYTLPQSVTTSFGLTGTGNTGVPARQDLTVWQSHNTTISPPKFTETLLSSWAIGLLHFYDSTAKILYLGDGTRISQENEKADGIVPFAGDGTAGYTDGPMALAAQFSSPKGLAVAGDGSVLIADNSNNRIRKISPNGTVATIAGTGNAGFSGDGGQATSASLQQPSAVSISQDGSVYIADTGNHRIRKIGADGIITTLAGNGLAGFSGDGGVASSAKLNSPVGVAVAQDGTVYIADTNNHRIRRVGPDGTINTVAGKGVGTSTTTSNCSGFFCSPTTSVVQFEGDGSLAINALLNHPNAITIAENGNLYIADTDNYRVRLVDPTGVISTVAGTGATGYSGDGGAAKLAKLNYPVGLALSASGQLFIADGKDAIRKIGSDGIIETIAGTGVADLSLGSTGGIGGGCTGFLCGGIVSGGITSVISSTASDFQAGSPPQQVPLNYAKGIVLSPNGSLLIADSVSNKILRIQSTFPGSTVGDSVIASQDGSQLFVFSPNGRHLRTINAVTGTSILEFAYDAQGRLSTITDVNGSSTRIERDALGAATAIVAPFGQRTTLITNPDGYLASVTSPAGETHQMTYSAGGLLTSFKTPNGHVSNMSYDAMGRLLSDTDAANGSQSLSRVEIANGFEVTRTTSLNRATKHRVENLTTGDQRRTDILPDATQTQTLAQRNGTTTTTQADGTVVTSVSGPDPRFAMQSPVTKSVTTVTAGLTSKVTKERTVTLSNPENPLSLAQLTERVAINDRTSTSTYNAATKTTTNTSAANRQTQSVIDAAGRVIESRVTGLANVVNSYDLQGRLASTSQGTAADQRTVNFAYNPQGYLQSATDPLGRSVSYEYDAAGRTTRQVMPDGQEILYSYDANGNLTSLTPPGRSGHVFKYTKIDQTAEYLPPDPGVGQGGSTLYQYDLDKALTKILRPDGLSIDFTYDAAGRLSKQTTPEGQTAYGYHVTTGKLVSLDTPDGLGLDYTYNGALLTQTAWSGAVAGTVGFSYDNDFRVTGVNVNGTNSIAYGYDADSLLTQAGALSLSRSSQNGLLQGSALGTISDTLSYNGFAEVTAYSAKAGAAEFFRTEFSYDKLGRIVQKLETVAASSNTYQYAYDLAGRLAEVKKNGSVQASYGYDANGNRTKVNGNQVAHYDDQDRLTDYNGATYAYTANGELLSKTAGAATTNYQYDVLGNLRHVGLPGGSQLDYLIDGQNRRIGKKRNGVLEWGLLYQDGLKPVAELDANGNVVSRFVYATHANVPDYLVKGGNTYRIVTDHLGSPRLVIKADDGTVIQRLDYDVWGNVIQDSNPGFQPFGFAGGLYDRDTKLVRFGARDYDPETGRWTAKDPIGFKGGDTNVYIYIFDDPLNRIDFDGKNAAVMQGLASLWGVALLEPTPIGEVVAFAASIGVGGYMGYEAMKQFTDTSARNQDPEDDKCKKIARGVKALLEGDVYEKSSNKYAHFPTGLVDKSITNAIRIQMTTALSLRCVWMSGLENVYRKTTWDAGDISLIRSNIDHYL